MENNILCVKNECTACRTCEQICPKKAIKMIENVEGFLYPIIDKDKCINCGICKKRCHVLNQINKNKGKKIYAIKPKNTSIAQKSTSAGVAYLMSEYILSQGGVVFGASYDKEFNVKHICATNKNELEKLRGSKYVISDTENTFSEVKKYLEKKIKVLYIGTACQISGLKNFLGKEYDGLLTIDIVCHGVPSNKLFKKYIKYLENRYNSKVERYDFRNKEKVHWGLGFMAKAELLKNSSKKQKVCKYIKADFDPYYYNFLKGHTYRESCYFCKYANIENRPADMTIADFWGIEKYKPNFYDGSGVSLCIINTNMGISYFNELKEKIEFEIATTEEATNFNSNLLNPTKRLNIRDNIYNEIDELEAEEYIKKHLVIEKNAKIIIKNLIPSYIKKIYKRLKR